MSMYRPRPSYKHDCSSLNPLPYVHKAKEGGCDTEKMTVAFSVFTVSHSSVLQRSGEEGESYPVNNLET